MEITYATVDELDKYLAMTPDELSQYPVNALTDEIKITIETFGLGAESDEVLDFEEIKGYICRLLQALEIKNTHRL